MPNRDQMWGPMSLEEYAQKLGEDLSQRPVDWDAVTRMPALDPVRAVRSGDSISSIMGNSNPAAVGAFMNANGLGDSRIRAGADYVVPQSVGGEGRAIGQAALNADNARLAERARRTVLPCDAVTVRPGASVFDGQKGILATQPSMALEQTVTPKAGAGYLRGSKSAGIAGKVLDGFDVANGVLGLRDGGRAAGLLGKGTTPLGRVLNVAEGVLEGVGEYKNGAKGEEVGLGVLGKTGVKTLLPVAGGAIGLLSPVPYITAPFLSAAGGLLADWLLKDTSSEAMGKKMQQNHNDAWMRSML